MMKRFAEGRKVGCDDRGQSMAEYGVVLGVVTVGAIAVLMLLADSVATALSTIATSIS